MPESAEVSGLLAEAGVAHEVSPPENPDSEARIMAGAGAPGMVTVAARLAGRGVDIVLGGADGARRAAVADRGGLCVLGAGRPARRRAEMHLRGRAGRQGDPGESRFFVSLSDEWVQGVIASVPAPLFRWLKGGEEVASVFRSLTRGQHLIAARDATWLVSGRAFDQVVADQRSVIYAERAALLGSGDVREQALAVIGRVVRAQVEGARRRPAPGPVLARAAEAVPGDHRAGARPAGRGPGAAGGTPARIAQEAAADAREAYGRREAEVGAAAMRLGNGSWCPCSTGAGASTWRSWATC